MYGSPPPHHSLLSHFPPDVIVINPSDTNWYPLTPYLNDTPIIEQILITMLLSIAGLCGKLVYGWDTYTLSVFLYSIYKVSPLFDVELTGIDIS